MIEKINNLECINDFLELEQCIGKKENYNLLNLFATYVFWSNPDYKYNETYLKDMIPKFMINIKRYSLKLEFREKILEEIQKIEVPQNFKCKLLIQIDGIWELKFENIYEDSIGKWIKTISETPKLNSVDNNKIYVKCQFNNSQGISFSDYLLSDDNLKLIKFVTDSVRFFIDRLGVVNGD